MRGYLVSLIQFMKSLTCKQAERWLERVKEVNPNAYKDIGKLLRRYDKFNDEAEVFRKMNEILLSLPELTDDFNSYLDDGTKFIVNPRNEVKINNFVKFVRKHRTEMLNSIIEMVSRLSSEYQNWSEMPDIDQGRLLKTNLREIVKDDPELRAYFEETFIFEPSEILGRLKLEHLTSSTKPQKLEEDALIQSISQPQKKVKKDPPARKEYEVEKAKDTSRSKACPPYMMNVNEEKSILRAIEKKLPKRLYESLIKILHLYYLTIINKDEVFELMSFLPAEDHDYMKDIVESREMDRRRFTIFRPLPDGDFHLLERATHSYVRMPETYPNICSGREKSQIARENLNGEWISVPRGTEESFHIRMKNTFEALLIKCEDERYEFDLFKKRLQVGSKYLKRAIKLIEEDPEDKKIKRSLQQIINMNVIQTIYKNSSKEQREEFEKQLALNPLSTLTIFNDRIVTLLAELVENREIHGLKIWNEVAHKNFQKSLDFKTNEFKRIEKIKCKPTIFIDQLKSRSSYLESRGRKKAHRNPFEDSKNFFSILNSFDFVSKKEKCLHRNLPIPQSFDVESHQIPNLLPVTIMAFENNRGLELTHSFLSFYIDNTVVNESEKFRCKSLTKRIMTKFFQVRSLECRVPSEKFNQIVFFELLQKNCLPSGIEEWICEKKSEKSEKLERMFEREERKEGDKKREWLVDFEPPSKYDFLPSKTDHNIVFYSSEHFYVLLRFFYTLYERVIRMMEVLADDHKIIAFQLLFFTCIRTKESIRFEESLTKLLGESAYIFTTFYKLVESVYKSLNTVSTCPINTDSIQVFHPSNEADYFYRLNKNLLQSPLAAGGIKLVRCVFELSSKLVYVNSISSQYGSEESSRELPRRRAEITQKIDYYAYMGNEEEGERKGNKGREKGKKSRLENSSEYCFEGNTIHMVNLPGGWDLVVSRRQREKAEEENVEVGKAFSLLSKIN